ncbi:hypothetical protein CEP53_003206 [Fusarium sp. AF-6]|nr:hypothetical protein CEP53_003206 [Fusarium sp. AF-6]
MAPESSFSSNAPAQPNHGQQALRIPSDLALILDDAGSTPTGPQDGPPAKKRSRTTTDYTHRKRVPVACQFCRLRKVKCDNARPSCSYCIRQQARCVYGENDSPQPPSPVSHDAEGEGEGSDQKILARLDEIKDMIGRLQVASPAASGTCSTTSPQTTSNYQGISPGTTQSPQIEAPRSQESTDRARCPRLNSSSFMAFRCEAILKWPVLRDIVPEKDAQIDSFLLVPEQNDGSYGGGGGNQNSTELTGLLQDGGLTRLCQRFLTLFHPRNPILDGKQLLRFAKIADEDGLRWDSGSCLLLASALGVTTQPWKKPPETDTDTLQRAQYVRDTAPLIENKTNAEAYFLAAKKRLGLLGDSLEFLFEIDLPPSGLGNLSYPDSLPGPPVTFATLGADIETKSLSPTNYNSQLEERGWCYYVAEISLRRTIDDTLQHLAEGGEESWLSNPSHLIRQYHELEKQRSLWRFHLPAIVHLDDEQVPDNEFAFGLRGRFLEWNELLLRPILYHVLHLPSDQTAIPESVELAEKAIHVCVQKIHEYQHTLRHGGSWFITRRIFAYACLILAAARQPERRIKLPLRWGSAIQVAIQTLGFWAQDAADVRHMSSTLDMMFSRMCL